MRLCKKKETELFPNNNNNNNNNQFVSFFSSFTMMYFYGDGMSAQVDKLRLLSNFSQSVFSLLNRGWTKDCGDRKISLHS